MTRRGLSRPPLPSETPCQNKPKKKYSLREQAVQAACILFELNTREQDLLEMAPRAGVPCGDDAPAGPSPANGTVSFTPPWYTA